MAKRLSVLLLSTWFLSAAGFAQEAQRAITQVAENLYRFQNNGHYSIFLVTGEGVIATDPINAEAASWLKAELARRFHQPVKYLIYSHDHADHISGGEVFADTAVVVAHRKTKHAIIAKQHPTAIPEVTFTDSLQIELGGQVVNLIYVGPSHSDNMIALHFPAQRAVFAVDFISVKRLPYRNLGDAYFPGWIQAIERVERLDFEHLIPAHGGLGNKADVREHRLYMQALYGMTQAAIAAGKTFEQIQEAPALTEFKHLEQYEQWLPLNLKGMYDHLTNKD